MVFGPPAAADAPGELSLLVPDELVVDGLLQPIRTVNVSAQARAIEAFFITVPLCSSRDAAPCLQQRAFEIGDEVPRILDPAGKPQESLADAERGTLLRREHAMRTAHAVRDRGRDFSQTVDLPDAGERAQETIHRRRPAAQIESQHSTGAARIELLRQGVLWMAGERRMIDRSDLGAPGQKRRDGAGVLAMSRHP